MDAEGDPNRPTEERRGDFPWALGWEGCREAIFSAGLLGGSSYLNRRVFERVRDLLEIAFGYVNFCCFGLLIIDSQSNGDTNYVHVYRRSSGG